MPVMTKHDQPIPHATIDLDEGGTLYVTDLRGGNRMVTIQEPTTLGIIPGKITQMTLNSDQWNALIDALRQPGETER